MADRLMFPLRVLAAAAMAVVAGLGAESSLAADDLPRMVAQAPDAKPGDLTKVRFAILGQPLTQYASFTIAKERGFFAKNGLDVELVSVDTTPSGLAALSAGTVQFSFTGTNVIDAVVAGLPIVMIFAVNNVPLVQICANESIRTPRDLIGKTVGVNNRGSTPDVAFRLWLQDKGIDESQMTIRNITTGEAVLRAAATSRAVDAYSSAPPICRGSATNDHHVLVNFAEIGMKLFGSGVAVTRDYLAANRTVVRKFVAALIEAHDLFRTDRDFAHSRIGAVENVTDPGIVQAAWNFYSKFWANPPVISEEAMLKSIRTSLNERTREIGPALVGKMYDNSLVEEVIRK